MQFRLRKGQIPPHLLRFFKSVAHKPRDLINIPGMVAEALREDGWFLRSIIVWHKPAAMPSSVTGWMWKRCRVKTKAQPKAVRTKAASCAELPYSRDYSGGITKAEKAEWTDCPGCKKCKPHGGYVLRRGSWRPTSSWEPVIMLAKTRDYFCDGEAVKTPPKDATVSRDAYTRVIDDPDEQFAVAHDHETVCDGANLRDVWSIPFEPLREAHYAAYPSELVYRCLAAGTSQEGYCDRCGKPFVRVVESKTVYHRPNSRGERGGGDYSQAYGDNPQNQARSAETTTLGWRPSCRCPDAKPRPGRVLDPFCGSGRTGIVARRLGLDFTGVELNPEFVQLTAKLIAEDAPLFNDVSVALASDAGGRKAGEPAPQAGLFNDTADEAPAA